MYGVIVHTYNNGLHLNKNAILLRQMLALLKSIITPMQTRIRKSYQGDGIMLQQCAAISTWGNVNVMSACALVLSLFGRSKCKGGWARKQNPVFRCENKYLQSISLWRKLWWGDKCVSLEALINHDKAQKLQSPEWEWDVRTLREAQEA